MSKPGISFDVVANLVQVIKQEALDYGKKYLEQRETKLRGN